MSDAAQPTAADVRAAAEAVKAALDRHLEAVERRAGASRAPAPAASGAGEGAGERAAELDAAVYAAFDELAAAGETYDELLYELYDEVTPFEIPGSDSLPAYAGPEVPSALSVLIRRDYIIAEPQRLLGQAERVTELDPESAEDDGVEGVTAGSSVHAALGVLFGEYEPDEIATRHKEFGLDEGDSTLWVCATDEPSEPGEWLAAPFEQADPQQVICRFDVSSVFDDEELLLVDDDTDETEDEPDEADDEDLDDEADQGDSEDEGAHGQAGGAEGGIGGVRGARVR
ncbi:hypothetical protein OIE63_34695 [Streptomyces sp. NBC_01795]|uniref:hypothetical protein n=1 Tax=unclassified Streptomyces TaxID=2593676 RepID=UPI002DDBA304|nr:MULTISPECIES: hypothetical protein [unclassified Streptomyces]WSA96132.1 hypothetical protein OIE63_34695 [Streptomyces sp. NBC_01795]WSS11245.1 hypothetical protein OG533_04450 [Streptomyces sp. NBC_01186]